MTILEEYDKHAVFKTPSSGERTLIVVDDFWIDACDYVSAQEERKEDILEDLRNAVGSESASGLAKFTSLAGDLDRMGRLVIGDFVAEGSNLGWISGYLESVHNSAFLIDIYDDTEGRPESILKGGDLARSLLKAGVPKVRMCYFTAVRREAPELSAISKRDIAENKISILKEWWNGVFGSIDKTYFDEKTGLRINSSPAPHNPDDLSQEYIQKSEFDDFLIHLSDRGGYGVWRWLMNRIDEIDNININKLDYLCAKSFLGYPDKDIFPYTALRALVYGLSEGLLDAKVVENIDTLPENLRHEFCWGSVSLSNSSTEFSDFAESLRNFLLLLERNAKFVSDDESVRLQSTTICRTDTTAIIIFNFSADLPSPVLEDTGKGQVTKAYKELGQNLDIYPSEKSLKIELQIP